MVLHDDFSSFTAHAKKTVSRVATLTVSQTSRLLADWARGISLVAVVLFLCAGFGFPAKAQTTMRLDVFSKTEDPNDNIPGWDAKKFAPIFGSGDKFFYQFVYNGPNDYYLHVKSGDNNSFTVGAKKEIVLPEWPVLAWEWKIAKTPKGGDVRVKELDDQGGSVCIVIDPGLTSFDSSLCYLFENDGPKDQPLTSQKDDKAKYLILRTAKADSLGQWYKERREILKDYKRVFGREPAKKAVIGIQIDSNDTKSSAEAFYRNFTLHKQ